MSKNICFHIKDFDGPLDLLFALISKNKMSLYDIQITTLIDQYLEIIVGDTIDKVEDTSAFVEMAAHLVQMKSYLLLPKSEQAERMQEELTGLLVEYMACKKIAAQLKKMSANIFIAVRKPLPMPKSMQYKHTHKVQHLTNAYKIAIGRKNIQKQADVSAFNTLVAKPVVSVEVCVQHILEKMYTQNICTIQDLFVTIDSRSESVATFLALLELIRKGQLSLQNKDEIEMISLMNTGS